MGRETNDITAEITIKRTIDLKYQRSQIAKIKSNTPKMYFSLSFILEKNKFHYHQISYHRNFSIHPSAYSISVLNNRRNHYHLPGFIQ